MQQLVPRFISQIQVETTKKIIPLCFSIRRAAAKLLTPTVANAMASLTPEELPVLVVLTWTFYGCEILAMIKGEVMVMVGVMHGIIMGRNTLSREN